MAKPSRTVTLTVAALAAGLSASAAPQSISFGPIPNQTFGVSPFPIAAKASSGLPVIFIAATPDVCQISSGLVKLLKTGTCSITAIDTGDAAPVTDLSVARTRPTVSFRPAKAVLLDWRGTSSSSPGTSIGMAFRSRDRQWRRQQYYRAAGERFRRIHVGTGQSICGGKKPEVTCGWRFQQRWHSGSRRCELRRQYFDGGIGGWCGWIHGGEQESDYCGG